LGVKIFQGKFIFPLFLFGKLWALTNLHLREATLPSQKFQTLPYSTSCNKISGGEQTETGNSHNGNTDFEAQKIGGLHYLSYLIVRL